MKKIFKNKGMTLVEVLLAIFVMAIMIGIGAPAINSYQTSLQLSGTAREIISGLRHSQELAVAEQVEYGIRFNFEEDKYQVVKFSNPEEIILTKNLPDKVNFHQIIGLTDNEAKYNPYGAVREEGSVSLINAKNEVKTILIRPSGFVKISN